MEETKKTPEKRTYEKPEVESAQIYETVTLAGCTKANQDCLDEEGPPLQTS